MSILHMPSLKSSVGSKRTSFQLSAASTAAREAGDCFAFRENPSSVLHSSWINRLRPTAPPVAACDRDGIHSPGAPSTLGKQTVSSCTPSSSVYNMKSIAGRHVGFFPRNPPPVPQLRRDNRADDEEGRLVASFGPFQVRAPRISAGSYLPEGRVFEKAAIARDGCFPLFRRMACLGDEREEEIGEGRKKGHDEPIGSRPSPSIFQFRPQLRSITGIHGHDEFGMEKEIADLNPHRNTNRFMDTDLVSSSWVHSHYRPRKNENTLQRPYPITDSPLIRVHEGHSPAGAWIASVSTQQAARSRGFSAYRDVSGNPSTSRNFQNVLVEGLCFEEEGEP